MDIRRCDRCGKEFKVHRPQPASLSGGDMFTPVAPAAGATSQDQPRPPLGLREMNKATLPVLVRDGSTNPPKQSYALYESDLCAQCVVDLQPVVSNWLAEKRPR